MPANARRVTAWFVGVIGSVDVMNATPATDARIYSRREAAAILGVTPTTLAHWAMQGRGPAYSRSGPHRGRVWYRPADLDRWLQSRSIEPGNPTTPT